MATVLVTGRCQERQNATLIAVVEFKKNSVHFGSSTIDTPMDKLLPPTDGLLETFDQLQTSLIHVLPIYMVPNMYVPVFQMPLNISGKLDRRAMHDLIEATDTEQLELYRNMKVKTAISTKTERQFQVLWSKALNINVELIGACDHFLKIGGDSVAAIRIVAAARDSQLRLTVADIFQYPELSNLAKVLDDRAANAILMEPEEIDAIPFALRKEASELQPEDLKKQLDQIAAQCDVSRDQIEDVYPCTPLQEGMMVITSRQPTAYLSRQVFSLDSSVDAARFSAAWQIMAKSAPILRTRILFGQHMGSLQVVLNNTLLWRQGSSLEIYLAEDLTTPITPGQPFNRFGLVEQTSGERFFVWTAHHSTCDNWSMNLMMQQVADVYLHKAIPSPVAYTLFIRYLAQADQEATKKYWREQLQDNMIADFPPLPHANYQPRPQQRVRQEIDMLGWTHEVSKSDVLHAAWTLVLAQYAGHNNSVFAVALSGRNAPVADILSLVAPTITTVPLHIHVDRTQCVRDFLQAVQEQRIGMIPHEHTGLQQIKRLVSDAGATLELRHLFIVQPATERETSLPIPGVQAVPIHNEEFDSYGLNVECTLGSASLGIDVRFDENTISTTQIKRILKQFAHVAQQLHDPLGLKRRVGDIELVSPEDIQQIRVWNKTVPPAVKRCLHEVAKTIRQQPNASAVHS